MGMSYVCMNDNIRKDMRNSISSDSAAYDKSSCGINPCAMEYGPAVV